jgi:fructokinase
MRVARIAGDLFPGSCAFHGDCVEGLASGPAIAARAGRPAESLDAGDPAWSMAAHALGGLLHNLTLTVAPSRILVGGGVASGQPRLLTLVRRALVDSLRGYAHAARIPDDASQFVVAPALGQRAGSLGAIALALHGM